MNKDLLRADREVIAYYMKHEVFGYYRLYVEEHVIPCNFQSGMPCGKPFTASRKATKHEIRKYNGGCYERQS